MEVDEWLYLKVWIGWWLGLRNKDTDVSSEKLTIPSVTQNSFREGGWYLIILEKLKTFYRTWTTNVLAKNTHWMCTLSLLRYFALFSFQAILSQGKWNKIGRLEEKRNGFIEGRYASDLKWGRPRKGEVLAKWLLGWIYTSHSICLPGFERTTCFTHSHGWKRARGLIGTL